MGLHSTQTLGPILDGLMRHTPDALGFIQTATEEGVGAAVQQRDQAFGDYSAGGVQRRPDPEHVISPE
jgi:enoyl-CoA hydratase